jgi:hypothetical protein
MGGTEGSTKENLLTSDGFAEGSTTALNVMAVNVGDVNKVVLRTTGTDSF